MVASRRASRTSKPIQEEPSAAASPSNKRKLKQGAEEAEAADTKAATGAAKKPKGRASKAQKEEEPEPAKAVEDDGAATEATAGPSAPSAPKKSRRKATAGGEPDSPAAPSGNDIFAFEGCPKTVDIPNPLSFTDSPRPSTSFRIASWNIVSLKSAEPKGLTRYLEAEDADLVVLTETKVNEVPSFFQSSRYPHQTWGIGSTKSYAGIAILSKIEPLSVQKGLPELADYDSKGRCITVEFEGCYVVGTYCVNAGEGLKTMEAKKKWNHALSAHLAKLDEKKPVIWTGDLNVVIDERDLAKASAKWNKSPGYTQIECDQHRAFLEGSFLEGAKPFKDVWREKHPDAVGHFTFYGWRGQCRIKGIGWRLDSFIVSERAQEHCTKCEIRHEVYGASDHVPIFADFDAKLFQASS
ncbi:hypothetical protein BCV69DRAFT_280066 [Microstroma glucosiphilum]|uniref:DNA-(apurinic or apyrimidinic site) endonuclease n=1 Tax=Pseudomicrostroma glucosiphilum TaxID=1684307 RepID=A0A316UFZ5_9BASI|nr:hypothetical protein BCV69DRAFT_280066 [Pseudomicrostroma glucosiphilum]PWN24169.1 hypothetical protein BCV69DRAFT_280066 [Pseudomicrostroma glucosiphilum]